MKHKRIVSVCSILGLALIIIVLLICIPITIPRAFGYETYAIISGSMEPEIPTGSIIYAKAVSPEDIAVGDVIVFYGGANQDAVTTHRVVKNDTEKRQFTTKGDANAGNDMLPVAYENLLGRVERSIPVLGKFLPALSDIRGKVYLACILAAAVLLRVLSVRLQKQK